MRFDDSLSTVLAGDTTTRAGAEAAWRQLVDLLGRGRVATDDAAIGRLRNLRGTVPGAVRAASARALAFGSPPPALVALFAEDELAIAAPVLRTATLDGAAWQGLVARVSPALRAVLRTRRDLPVEATRALEAFGPVDFVIGDARPAQRSTAAPAGSASSLAEPSTGSLATQPVRGTIATPTPTDPVQAAPAAAPPADRVVAPPVDQPVPPRAPLGQTPFVALGDVARGLPVVAEALRRAEPAEPAPDPIPAAPTPDAGQPGGFAISDLVRRIEAFHRDRPEPADRAGPAGQDGFRYQTDATGTVIAVEGVGRAGLVGISFALDGRQGLASVDGVIAGAFRRRSPFSAARLVVEGEGDAAGAWRVAGVPAFDEASGRFTGYRGTARRPRADEAAEPRAARQAASDSLRQLVHELRTPANAITGFAELIESQLLGPVGRVYREQAQAIRRHADHLVAAIEDLDMAARIEGRALDLRPGTVAVAPLLARALGDLAPLAVMRGVETVLAPADTRALAVDDRAAERLVGRLLAAVVSAAQAGERVGIAARDADAAVEIAIDRPADLRADGDEELLTLAEAEEEQGPGAPLLGTGFALRLARRLAGEMGGRLIIAADRLTLRLPAAVTFTHGAVDDLLT